jgi:hypothetical protein
MPSHERCNIEVFCLSLIAGAANRSSVTALRRGWRRTHLETLEHSDRDKDHRPTDENGKHSEVPSSPTVETDIPPANRQNEQSAREKQYGLDKRRYRVEFFTLVVVLIHAGVAYRQWRAMVVANQNAT